MNDDVAIKVTNVSKSFKLPHDKQNSIKGGLISLVKNGKRTYEKQEVLKDISFEIKKGEFFGIVGRNGSGKSTLLKILAGIYTPTAGSIQVSGSLTPFIELGVGFNPELTGRENVFLNGALLGFNRTQMDAMYDDIVAFSEIERFMDQKLKNYSSGMQVRLAFSIAIRARSDILLLDEVLAVGDEAFQRKCFDVFEEYKAKKQTIILVTHDMESVKRFCSRALLLKDGEIVRIGNPRAVADEYTDLNARTPSSNGESAAEDESKQAPEIPKPKYLDAKILNSNTFATNEKLQIEVSWTGLPDKKFESIGINIFRLSGEHITGINSRTGNLNDNWRDKGSVILEFDLNLGPGMYYFEINLFSEEGKELDTIYEGPKFEVINKKPSWSGMTELGHTWVE